jgi:deazaflavin-dependent oxidoreductase (nitroreductase family)
MRHWRVSSRNADDGCMSTTMHTIPRPTGFVGWLFSLPKYLYHAHLGLLFGHRFLLLVHEGRRSGRRYETPLEVIRYDARTHEAIVAAGWGRRTQWLHNVEAGGARQVWIGRERFVPEWRELTAEDGASTLEWYENHSGIPKVIVRAVLSRLLGWHYGGSPADRRRAVAQLPMVSFEPAVP